MRPLTLLVVALAFGCGAEEPVGRLGGAAPSVREEVAAERSFGSALDRSRPITPLASILAQPERYRDQVVRTEGQIAQVCQRMGCWIELRPVAQDEQGAEGSAAPAVRVPMAGHSFFLPRDVAGRPAMLEGRVVVEPLSADVRAHLEEEGATATASALSIHASGVVVR